MQAIRCPKAKIQQLMRAPVIHYRHAAVISYFAQQLIEKSDTRTVTAKETLGAGVKARQGKNLDTLVP